MNNHNLTAIAYQQLLLFIIPFVFFKMASSTAMVLMR